jgi:hypothetical protein
LRSLAAQHPHRNQTNREHCDDASPDEEQKLLAIHDPASES